MTATTMAAVSIPPTSVSAIGQRRRLVEGESKVTGKIRFVSDISLPGMLHARLVFSPHAHARIKSIDVSAAAAVPGVAAVLTAQDLPNIPPVSRQRLLLARDRVIFAGQPVALILAESEAIGEDALELVAVQYEPLPAAVTLDQALAKDAPLVWPGGKPGESEEAAAHGADAGGDDAAENKASNIASQSQFARGDLAAGFAAADQIIERTFTISSVHQSPLETHGCAVQMDPYSDQVTVWSSTQGPFMVRENVAAILGLSETDVKCIGTPVGGGFGGKGCLYEPLLALACRVVGRPIRLILTRNDELIATVPTPEGRIRVKLGAQNDGAFTALEFDVMFNSGCFPGSPIGIALLIGGSMYNVPNVVVTGADVLSFRQSVGAYRAPGIPQSMFALESVVDEMARTLKADPVALRLQNAAGPGANLINGKPWPKMGMREVLHAVQAHPLWQQRAQARAAGRGVGLAIGGWLGGTGPASAACKLERNGELHIQVGSADISGTNTSFASLAAEAFGIAPEKVKITNNDTDGPAFALNAAAARFCIRWVMPWRRPPWRRRQTLEHVSQLLEVDPEDLEIIDGKVQVKGSPDSAIALSELAAKTMQFGGVLAPIIGHGRHAVTSQSPGFCAQLAEVEVDADTGEITLHKLVIIQDVGRAINPAAVEGQMIGGAMQGVGWALHESMLYDDYGQPITASWMDYNMPSFVQSAPEVETVLVEVPSDFGPAGAKGVGEPPVTPTAAAIGNAIREAAGIRMTHLPMTAPRVVEMMANG
ncbi:MAG: xanthine dehydrogenase family protein molybdopterin-binding subunit [Caldilineaceae bacterium]